MTAAELNEVLSGTVDRGEFKKVLQERPKLPGGLPLVFRFMDAISDARARVRKAELEQAWGQRTKEGLERHRQTARERREQVAVERRLHLSIACPVCGAFEGQLCVTMEGAFPGRECYTAHAGRRRASKAKQKAEMEARNLEAGIKAVEAAQEK